MARAVYSGPLLQYSTETPNTSYEVAAGFTAVVRQITVLQNIGAYDFGAWIDDGAGVPGIWIDYAHGLGALEVHQQEGRWVIPEGGFLHITFSTIGSGISAYLGGYLLRND